MEWIPGRDLPVWGAGPRPTESAQGQTRRLAPGDLCYASVGSQEPTWQLRDEIVGPCTGTACRR